MNLAESAPALSDLITNIIPSFLYRFYGHFFRSNVPLPGVEEISSHEKDGKIQLHLGISPSFVHDSSSHVRQVIYSREETGAAYEPALLISKIAGDDFVEATYSDGMRFWIDRSLNNVWAVWPSTASQESALATLLGPILGLLLRLRGVTCLHASAVALGDCALAFLGATGSGKSTTAAAFAREGCAVLCDDLVALSEMDGGFHVMPGYPRVCLWPSSVQMLFGPADALPRILPEDEKLYLALGSNGVVFETRHLPLAAIYILGERRVNSAPSIEVLRGQSALLALVADTFANKVLDREMRAREFEVLGRLVEEVPVRKIYPHQDASRISDLCRLIREDFSGNRQSVPDHP